MKKSDKKMFSDIEAKFSNMAIKSRLERFEKIEKDFVITQEILKECFRLFYDAPSASNFSLLDASMIAYQHLKANGATEVQALDRAYKHLKQ